MKMEEADRFLIKLKNSTLFKVVAAYAAIAFVFVFLSNRVHPDAENRKIISLGIRTRIQKEFMNAIK